MFSPGKLGGSISAQANPTNYFPPAPPMDGFNPLQLTAEQRDRFLNASQAMERDNQMQPMQPVSFGGGQPGGNQQLLEILANLRGNR